MAPFGVTVTDADQNSTTTLYNDSLQPAKEIDALGDSTSLSYDDYGNLTKIVSPQGETVSLNYDAAGDLTGEGPIPWVRPCRTRTTRRPASSWA